MNFELICNEGFEIAETPIWDERIGKLYYTDLFTGDVHRFDPLTKERETWKTNSLIGSAVPTSDPNKLMCAIDRGLCLLDLTNGEISVICDPNEGNERNRYNDTRVDPAGRIFASTVAKLYGTDEYQPDMMGKFFQVEQDGSVRVIEEAINQYNAMVWNSDATKMYVIDTYHQTLVEYDYNIATGVCGAARVAIDFAQIGMPDGMCIDSEDNLYVCHWSGKVSVWDKNLKPVRTIEIPVEYAACGGFGGAEYADYYLATAKYCYNDEQLKANPGAGGIFCAKGAARGRGDHFYIIK